MLKGPSSSVSDIDFPILRREGRALDRFTLPILPATISGVRRALRLALGALVDIKNSRIRGRIARELDCKVPANISITPTLQCNLDCPGCYTDSHENGSLDLTEIEAIIQQGLSIGINEFSILGGEPFMWEDLPHVVKKHPNCRFGILSNGLLIAQHPEKLDAILGATNVNMVVSLWGGEKTSEQFRGNHSYQEALSAISIARSRGVPTSCAIILNDQNIDDALNLKTLIDLYRAGAISVYYQFFHSQSDETQHLKLSRDKRKLIHQRIEELRAKAPLVIANGLIGDRVIGDGSVNCAFMDSSTFHVRNDGKVGFCFLGNDVIGDIREETFLEILIRHRDRISNIPADIRCPLNSGLM